MKIKKKEILITNDDGIDARGIKVLIELFRPVANLLVVAP
ncbi:MAG: 5'/3'-nucleotidase SurE, partial [Bacteroidota bacterium]|nr:5'/3'-nucleotidase SurE [Bacteroidota bacterium]